MTASTGIQPLEVDHEHRHTLGSVIAIDSTVPEQAGCEPYRAGNLLDRLSTRATLEAHYRHMMRRERLLLARRLGVVGGEVLSVGCGWHPGRHLFPSPSFRLTAVDADPDRVAGVASTGSADEAHVGYAGKLDLPAAAFDVVLYRLVLHHVAFQGPLGPCFAETARLLRPGGALVAIEPGLWHPVGLGLALANRIGAATALHGTPDDIPLSPRRLTDEALAAGLSPELHAVTYTWRRLPRTLQRALRPLDAVGSRPRSAAFGHTLLLIARAPEHRGSASRRPMVPATLRSHRDAEVPPRLRGGLASARRRDAFG